MWVGGAIEFDFININLLAKIVTKARASILYDGKAVSDGENPKQNSQIIWRYRPPSYFWQGIKNLHSKVMQRWTKPEHMHNIGRGLMTPVTSWRNIIKNLSQTSLGVIKRIQYFALNKPMCCTNKSYEPVSKFLPRCLLKLPPRDLPPNEIWAYWKNL